MEHRQERESWMQVSHDIQGLKNWKETAPDYEIMGPLRRRRRLTRSQWEAETYNSVC